MKNKTLLQYVILILLTLCSCENENPKNKDSPELSTNKPTKSKIDNLSMDQLSKDKQFDEISNAFMLDETFAKAKNAVTKGQSLDEDDFTIDFSSANKMESKIGTSYTFLIKKDQENRKNFENLVVEKHNDGTISGFIVYYEYSQRYLDSLKKGIVIPFDGTLRRTANKENLKEIKDLFREKKTAKTGTTARSTAVNCTETRYVTSSLCPGQERHSNGQACPFGPNGIWYGYYLQTVISCIDTNTWGWTAESTSYTSTVPDPNVTSGGGSYSSTATVEPSLFSTVAEIQSFTNYYGLVGAEVEWARYIPNRSMVEGFMDNNSYEAWAKAFVKYFIGALLNGDLVDLNEAYIEANTPDDGYIYTGDKALITNPLTLSNGNQISVEFGTTESDNRSANQLVSVDLISSIKFAIEEANSHLSQSDKITSIYVMATTNGKHGPTSNHANGTAVDISRINGVKMTVSGVTNKITELQKAFDAYIYIRENFGPYFKHKFNNTNNTWNYNFPIGGHKDHIHVSVRR